MMNDEKKEAGSKACPRSPALRGIGRGKHGAWTKLFLFPLLVSRSSLNVLSLLLAPRFLFGSHFTALNRFFRFTVHGSRFTALTLLTVLLLGWTAAGSEPVREAAAPPPPLFSPQSVMESGDYEGFLIRNSETLKSCTDPDECSGALFNLIFVHIYSKSPYYNPRTALQYIHDLVTALPNSQLAAQAKVWEDLLQKYMRERARKSKRPATQEELTRQESSEPPDEGRLEDQIKARDEIIEKLNRQLERSRQIDIEMEQRERGLR